MIGKILLLVVTMVALTLATPYGRSRGFSVASFPPPMPRGFGKYSRGLMFGQGGFGSGPMVPAGVLLPAVGMQPGFGGFQSGFGGFGTGFGTFDGGFDAVGGFSGGFGPSFGTPLPGFSSFDFQGPLDQFGGGFVDPAFDTFNSFDSGFVGPSQGFVGPSSGFVGPTQGFVGPSSGFVGTSSSFTGPSSGFVGPSSGFVGPSSGFVGRSSSFLGQSSGFKDGRRRLASP